MKIRLIPMCVMHPDKHYHYMVFNKNLLPLFPHSGIPLAFYFLCYSDLSFFFRYFRVSHQCVFIQEGFYESRC